MAKTFEVLYQAPNAAPGATVQVDVYKADKSLDVAQSGAATPIGTTGRYYKTFNADAPGWFAEISDDQGGKAVKHFGKPEWGSHGIFDLVGDVQTAVDAVQAAVDAINTAVGVSDGKIDSLAVDVTTALAALSALDVKIDGLGNPPMIG